MSKKTRNILIGLAIGILVAIGLYFLPPIHSRLAWRVENLQTSIYYFFNPPQDVVFVPSQQALLTTTELPTATETATPLPVDIATPTVTSTPVPQTVMLDNITFIDQMHRWNYCGPANLAMALEYWGYTGEPGNASALRDQIGGTIKPGVDDPSLDFIQRSQTDVNVMPYELVDYVNDYTNLRALYRFGGDLDLLKRLIAAGFPVITEKGIYQTLPPENTMQWAGHYAFTTGYDEATQEFIYQDSYTPNEDIPYEDQGYNVRMGYEEYVEGWRAFNYVFIVVYDPADEAALFRVLGDWGDESWAFQNALNIAQQDNRSLTGVDQYFAWYNTGTSYGLLTDYGNAALAYDTAFSIYNNLPEADRPYRVMWYQTGPYKAYYYTSRYQDVINLADSTESTLYNHRVLEETFYWRALANYALGNYALAETDMRQVLYYHPGFQAALDKMAEWGLTP